jgi:hypothetical protein
MSIISHLRHFLNGNFEPKGKFRTPRIWSNNELKKVGLLFGGSIINVSGKVDSDKYGGLYKSYFPNAKEYFVSNYNKNPSARTPTKWNFNINLDEELPSQFQNRFDVVFNHTTLEHIYDMKKAFKNLCAMSKDIVIIVVPFIQQMHFGASYRDYWRFTPYALKEMFEKEGMTMVYISANNKRNESIYLFTVASKNPDAWRGILPKTDEKIFTDLGERII